MGPCLELESAFLQTPAHSCSLQFKKPWAVKKDQIWVSSSEVEEPRACIQNEVSQKNKYHILTHLYEI